MNARTWVLLVEARLVVRLATRLCHEPIAFEVLGLPERIAVQFAVNEEDSALVQTQLRAHFPEALFQARESSLEEVWDSSKGDDALAVEFGLAREFMFPLASGKLDPFVGIIGALAALRQRELALFQVLFEPTHHPWAESITRSVTHPSGSPFFVNAPELADAAKSAHHA